MTYPGQRILTGDIGQLAAKDAVRGRREARSGKRRTISNLGAMRVLVDSLPKAGKGLLNL